MLKAITYIWEKCGQFCTEATYDMMMRTQCMEQLVRPMIKLSYLLCKKPTFGRVGHSTMSLLH